MADRTISLSKRKESVRQKNEVASVAVQFELEQIKQHFYDSLKDINNQFSIADELCKVGKNTSAKDVWRSQIVFLEGIFDFYIHELSKYALVQMFNGKDITNFDILTAGFPCQPFLVCGNKKALQMSVAICFLK